MSLRIYSPLEDACGEIGLQLDFDSYGACLDWVESHFIELVFFDAERAGVGDGFEIVSGFVEQSPGCWDAAVASAGIVEEIDIYA